MGDRIFKFFTDLIDNATLIIIVLGVVMVTYQDPEIIKLIVAGLLGYMAKGGKDE